MNYNTRVSHTHCRTRHTASKIFFEPTNWFFVHNAQIGFCLPDLSYTLLKRTKENECESINDNAQLIH